MCSQSLAIDPSPQNFYWILKDRTINSGKFHLIFALPTGKASHASVAPWLGLNALDAVVQCYNNVSMMRQQMLPECRVHGIITKGGEKPNIIPQLCQLEYFVRGTTDEQRDELKKKVLKCAQAASVSTGLFSLLFCSKALQV